MSERHLQRDRVMGKSMKTIKTAMSLLAAALMAAGFHGCTKENAARFEGNYSFATSGTVTAVPSDPGTAGDTVTLKVSNERGQMEIIRKDGSRNEMMMTMNIIAGDAVIFDNLYASGRILEMREPYTSRTVGIETGVLPSDVTVTVSGTAEKFTDVVMFSLRYTGTLTYDGLQYVIIDSDIDCIAKEND